MSFSPPKHPGEDEFFTFDYALLLESDESIVDATWSITVASGVDADPAALLSGDPVIEDAQVHQLVTGGLADVQYKLHCLAETSAGQKLELSDTVWVRAS